MITLKNGVEMDFIRFRRNSYLQISIGPVSKGSSWNYAKVQMRYKGKYLGFVLSRGNVILSKCYLKKSLQKLIQETEKSPD